MIKLNSGFGIQDSKFLKHKSMIRNKKDKEHLTRNVGFYYKDDLEERKREFLSREVKLEMLKEKNMDRKRKKQEML